MCQAAIYPGTFDPVTYGHIDIIKRAHEIFSDVVVAVAHNPHKKPVFDVKQRVDLLKKAVSGLSGVEVIDFQGLVVELARKRKAKVLIRGLRMLSDFEYEFQMALMNRKLNRDIQTVFLMTGLRWIFTSSSIIKEAACFGGNINGMVPPIVNQRLKEKFEAMKKQKNDLLAGQNTANQ